MLLARLAARTLYCPARIVKQRLAAAWPAAAVATAVLIMAVGGMEGWCVKSLGAFMSQNIPSSLSRSRDEGPQGVWGIPLL